MAIQTITDDRSSRTAALASAFSDHFLSPSSKPSRYAVTAEMLQDDARPFAKVAPMGNLRPDREMLERAKPNTGALFFYNCRLRGQGPARHPAFVLFTLGFCSLVPGFQPAIARENRFYKGMTEMMADWLADCRAMSPLTTVKKTSKGFEVDVPIAAISQDKSGRLLQRMIGRNVGSEESNELSTLIAAMRQLVSGEVSIDVPTSKLYGISFLEGKKENKGSNALTELHALPKGRIYSVKAGTQTVVMLHCLFTIPECEFLTQTPWAQIRPFDVFQLMVSWAKCCHGSFGSKVKPPVTSKPLQYIADTRAGEGTPRTNELGIFVDERAEFWRIPTSHNQIGKFDSDASRNYLRSDGSMSGITDLGELAPKMPSNLVFVDWLNLKLAYSNTEGNLTIKDLARTQKATPVHYKAWMDRPALANSEPLVSFYSAGRLLNLPSAQHIVPIKLVVEEVAMQMRAAGNMVRPDAIRIHEIFSMPSPPGSIVDKYCKAVDELRLAMEQPGTLEMLYDKMSVATVHQTFAYATILALDGRAYFDAVHPVYRAETRAYREQQLDPEYQTESIPYIEEGKFLQPHQNRCMNKLRGSPKLAVLSVAAGGGKTVLAITDFLKELKKGNVKRGLIMCPSHLVAQYVKEVVDFVNGRLNVIAVSSYTVATHGVDGLSKLIQSAPPNSFVVADYNLVKGTTKNLPVGYGGARTPYQPVIEMLMSFNFDWVCMDESHTLKNSESNMARAISKLVTTIPYKRIMSGTLMPDSIQDLVQQVNMLDPTVFGTHADFVTKYSEDGKDRGKRTRWKEGYANDIMRDLKERVTLVEAHRKEWAALLPKLVESARDDLYLTPAQQSVYDDVLMQTVAELSKLPKNHAVKKLFSAMNKTGGEEDKAGEGEGDEESDDGVDLSDDLTAEQLLRRSTQALEEFVSNPTSHALGRERLSGNDLVSPKVHALVEVINKHIADGVPGKILVFCNYRDTAEHIYQNLPADLKARTIHYTAENKTACVAEFSGNDEKLIMVGVETSMNTGLNLQMASHLVRVDTVWTPGALEQGNSRVLRPNVKTAEFREKVYITWLLVQRTIDCTKSVYLFSKRVLVGLVENYGNPLFDRVPALTPIPLSLDVIAESNTTTSENLQPYYEAYEEYLRAQARDYENYKRDHPEDLDPATGGMRRMQLSRAPNLPNSKLMARVPYVPGTELYGAADLGLQRYDVFMRLSEAEAAEIAEDDGDGAEDASQRAKNRMELQRISGLAVHTEYGDGIITGASKKNLRVEFADGTSRNVNKMACFFITRKQTNAHDMREAVLAAAGEVPFDVTTKKPVKRAKPQVPPQEIVIPEPPKPEKKAKIVRTKPADTRVAVALDLIIVNDFVGLEMSSAASNKSGAMALQAIGFRQPEPYVYAEIPNADIMLRLFSKWKKDGYGVVEEYNDACVNLYHALRAQRKNAAHMVGLATQADLNNFYRLQHVRVRQNKAGVTKICPYPLVQDDALYICLPLQGHPESLKAIQSRVPGIKWAKADTESTLQVFMPNLKKFDVQIKKLMKSKDLVITNIDDLLKQRDRLVRRRPVLFEGTR